MSGVVAAQCDETCDAATIRAVAHAKRVLRPDVHFEAHYSEILNVHGCVFCAFCI
jgi:formate hydrogenlyase subunit 6/NADH:ubiquinone oxidoreductase subunit I